MALTSISRWDGRFALVTGASYGLGSEFCRALTQHGIHVIGCGRSVDKIKALAAELAAACQKGVLYPYQCDLTQESEIVAMFEWIAAKFGGVDICVNNAGVSFGEPVLGCTLKKVKQVFDLNVHALLSCDNKAIASMEARGVDDGHIFHINSMVGHAVSPWAISHAYGASKYAVTEITEALRLELAARHSKIRVTSLSPGFVDTPMIAFVFGEEAAKSIVAQNPCLTAKDVADVLIFVLSTPANVQIQEVMLQATGSA